MSDSAGGLSGHEILKVHDADPFLGVEVKFVDAVACQQFLASYSSRALHQYLSQHACRLLALPQELTVGTQLKAGTHVLDLCLDDPGCCLKRIHLSQVRRGGGGLGGGCCCCCTETPRLLRGLLQPERLCDEEIDRLEKLLKDQALRQVEQGSNTDRQEESPVPNNCFRFQNRIFGE